MLSYYVIYYEKFKTVIERTEKEALSMCNINHVWTASLCHLVDLAMPSGYHHYVIW